MKTISAAITIISLALTGCAPGYYQQDYSGYNTSYGGAYSVESYYGAPVQSYYYQPGSIYTYDRYYSPSHPSQHRDHDSDHRGDRDRHENWVNESPRHKRQQSNDQQHGQRQWTSEMPHQQQENFDRATERAQRQQLESRGHSRDGDQPSHRQRDSQQQHSRRFSEAAPAESGMSHGRRGGDDTSGRGEGRRRRD